MWEEVDRILHQATSQIVDQIANFLPGVMVSLLLLLAALVVAGVVRVLLVRVLRGLEFDRHAEQWGLAGFANWSVSSSPSLAMARAMSWVILFLGVLVSLTALNATIPSRLAMSMFDYVPHLLAALMILVGGAILARFLARSTLIGAVNMRIRFARLLPSASVRETSSVGRSSSNSMSPRRWTTRWTTSDGKHSCTTPTPPPASGGTPPRPRLPCVSWRRHAFDELEKGTFLKQDRG